MIGASVKNIVSKYNVYPELANYREIIVTKDGEIFNTITNKQKRLFKDINGYMRVAIGNKSYLVHRLVALLYIEKPKQHLVIVCHKNKNREDNRVINLMWTDNNFINIRRKDFKKKNYGRPIVALKIGCTEPIFCSDGGDAERKLKVNRSEVYRCCKGERKTTGGYRFMYGKDYCTWILGWDLSEH